MQEQAPDPIDIHVGGRFRTRRRHEQLSQQDVARELGMTFQQVQKYERGTNRISASVLYRAARILKVSPGWFFEGLPVKSDDAVVDMAQTQTDAVLRRATEQVPEILLLPSLSVRARRSVGAIIEVLAAAAGDRNSRPAPGEAA